MEPSKSDTDAATPTPVSAWSSLNDAEKSGAVLGPLGALIIPLMYSQFGGQEDGPVWPLLVIVGLVAVPLMIWGLATLFLFLRWRRDLTSPARRSEVRTATVSEHVWVYSVGEEEVTSDTLTGYIRWTDETGETGRSRGRFPKSVLARYEIGQEIQICDVATRNGPTQFWVEELPPVRV